MKDELSTCPDWFESLSARVDGEEQFVRSGLDAHLRECQACRRTLGALVQDRQAVKQAPSFGWLTAEVTDSIMKEVKTMAVQQVKQAEKPRLFVKLRFRWMEALASAAMLMVLAAIIFPVFARAREKARTASCQSNLKQIGLGLIQYAQDHGGYLPQAWNCEEAVMPYIKNEQVFRCPTHTNLNEPSYSLRLDLSGRKLPVQGADRLVLVYEGTDGAVARRHDGGANYCFADSHVKWFSGEFKELGRQSARLGGSIPAPPPGREVAYEASMKVQVDDVAGAVYATEEMIGKCGGFILESSFSADHGQRPEANVVFRVPSDRLGEVARQIGQLGTLLIRSVNGEDLTEQYVALHDSLRTEEATFARVQQIAHATQKKGDRRVMLADRLRSTRTAADEVRKQARAVAARTKLSTVRATFLEYRREKRNLIPASLQAPLRALGVVGRGAVCILGWIVVFGPIFAPLMWWWKRRRAVVPSTAS